jgi:SAM-dependent methyltransferase
MSKISEYWESLEYQDVASYTQMTYPKWLQDFGQSLFRDSTIAVIESMTEPLHPLERVVDLGCGVGDWTRQYLRFAREVVGVDINQSFVDKATRDAEEDGVGDRARFVATNIVEWDDFEDAGLVCLGAVMTCLDEDENRTLLDRIADAQRPGQFLYVRATVLNPGRQPYSTGGGHYRPRRWYDELFHEFGYRSRLVEFSTSLVGVGSLARLGMPPRLASLSTFGVNGTIRAARILKRDVDYCNWFLKKAE